MMLQAKTLVTRFVTELLLKDPGAISLGKRYGTSVEKAYKGKSRGNTRGMQRYTTRFRWDYRVLVETVEFFLGR